MSTDLGYVASEINCAGNDYDDGHVRHEMTENYVDSDDDFVAVEVVAAADVVMDEAVVVVVAAAAVVFGFVVDDDDDGDEFAVVWNDV